MTNFECDENNMLSAKTRRNQFLSLLFELNRYDIEGPYKELLSAMKTKVEKCDIEVVPFYVEAFLSYLSNISLEDYNTFTKYMGYHNVGITVLSHKTINLFLDFKENTASESKSLLEKFHSITEKINKKNQCYINQLTDALIDHVAKYCENRAFGIYLHNTLNRFDWLLLDKMAVNLWMVGQLHTNPDISANEMHDKIVALFGKKVFRSRGMYHDYSGILGRFVVTGFHDGLFNGFINTSSLHKRLGDLEKIQNQSIQSLNISKGATR